MNLTLGDLGGAVGGIDQDIATFGTECGGNSLSKSVNTLEEAGTSFNTKLDLLVAVSKGNDQTLRNGRNTVSIAKQDDPAGNCQFNAPCEQNAAAGGSRLSDRREHAWKRPTGRMSG